MKLTIELDMNDDSDRAIAALALGLEGTTQQPQPQPQEAAPVKQDLVVETPKINDDMEFLHEEIGKKVTKTSTLSDGTIVRVDDEVYQPHMQMDLVVLQTYRGTVIAMDEAGNRRIFETKALTAPPSGDEEEEPEIDDVDVLNDDDGSDVLDDDEPQAPKISYDELHDLATKCVRAIGGLEVKRIVSESQDGADKMSQLSEDNWQVCYDKLTAALNEQV